MQGLLSSQQYAAIIGGCIGAANNQVRCVQNIAKEGLILGHSDVYHEKEVRMAWEYKTLRLSVEYFYADDWELVTYTGIVEYGYEFLVGGVSETRYILATFKRLKK